MELLFLDTETGGLDPFKDSLLQVGLVAYIDGKIADKKFISIKQESYSVTAEALKYNKLDLYKDVYENGCKPREALDEVIDFIQRNFNDRPILVGHNVSLDKYFLKQLFNKQNESIDKHINHRMIDTMSLLWGLHIANRIPKEACSSDGAFKYFNIEVKNRHNALDDCTATVKLYEELIQMIKQED